MAPRVSWIPVLVLTGLLAAGCDPNTIVVVEPAADAGQDAPEADAAEDALDTVDVADADPVDTLEIDTAVGPDARMLPAASNLIAYWPCDEGMGAIVNDASGQGNHGTLQKPAGNPWAPGRVGSALDLSSDNWVTVPPSPSIDTLGTADQLTVAAWIWVASYTPTHFNFIVSRQYELGPYDSFGLTLLDGKPTFALFASFISAAERVPLRRWVHVAITYDGATARVFVNGAQAAQMTNARGISSETRPVLIGGNQNDSTGMPKEFLDGFVDEIVIYNRALRSAEVMTLFATTPP